MRRTTLLDIPEASYDALSYDAFPVIPGDPVLPQQMSVFVEDALTTSPDGRSRFVWMKTAEAAHACRVTAETVIAWAKAGILSATKTPGGHYRFDPAEVHALMSANALQQAGGPSPETPQATPIRQDSGRPLSNSLKRRTPAS